MLQIPNLVKAEDVTEVDVALGDGNDVLTTTGLVDPPGLLPREAFVIARGDAGDDTLTGGAERDDFNGGAGADTISGGDGIDPANFSQRTQPLTISLDGVATTARPARATTCSRTSKG